MNQGSMKRSREDSLKSKSSHRLSFRNQDGRKHEHMQVKARRLGRINDWLGEALEGRRIHGARSLAGYTASFHGNIQTLL